MPVSGEIPPLPTEDLWEYLKGGWVGHCSAAVCTDGRVIYMYESGGYVYQCHYGNDISFAMATNTDATTPYEISSHLAIELDRPRPTVFAANGGLYMVINVRLWTYTEGRMYTSPSGTGESAPGVPDWTLASVIWTGGVHAEGFFNEWNARLLTGRPAINGNTWAVPMGVSSPGGEDYRSGIAVSTNGPAGPWSIPVKLGFYILGGRYGTSHSRNFGYLDGAWWWAAYGNAESSKYGTSSNLTSWSTGYSGGGWENGIDYLFEYETYKYRLNTGGGSATRNIERTTGAVLGSWEHYLSVASFIDSSFPNGQILVELLDGKYALLWNGRIFAQRIGGWTIDSVGMG